MVVGENAEEEPGASLDGLYLLIGTKSNTTKLSVRLFARDFILPRGVFTSIKNLIITINLKPKLLFFSSGFHKNFSLGL